MDSTKFDSSTTFTDSYLKKRAISKKVAALLAENAVKVNDVNEIFRFAMDYLIIAIPHSDA